MEHATHEVKVDAIYKVAKLKKEVAKDKKNSDFR